MSTANINILFGFMRVFFNRIMSIANINILFGFMSVDACKRCTWNKEDTHEKELGPDLPMTRRIRYPRNVRGGWLQKTGSWRIRHEQLGYRNKRQL